MWQRISTRRHFAQSARANFGQKGKVQHLAALVKALFSACYAFSFCGDGFNPC